MLSGTNLQYANSYNVRIVLEIIRLYGPVSRIDIARRTNLTAQTVTNITKNLMQEGLIFESDRKQAGRGAPSILLEINKDAAYSIGFDFDKDHLTGILVDIHGNKRQRINYDLNFPSPDEVMDLITEMVDELIQMENIDRDLIWGVGVGFPGPLVITEGNVHFEAVNPEDLPDWDKVPVVEILEKKLNIPVYLENNASAAAIGEKWYGSGKHLSNFFYVFFGAGLGGGLVINGQLYSGFAGNAGEVGYIPTSVGPEVVTGQSDSEYLGSYFNIATLIEKLRESGAAIDSASELEALFDDGNPILMEWIDTAIHKLTPLVISIEYLIDPQAIYFGGRLPDKIIRHIVDKLEEYMPNIRITRKVNIPELQLATVGIDTAALGVATLPLYASLSPSQRLLMKESKDKANTINSKRLRTL